MIYCDAMVVVYLGLSKSHKYRGPGMKNVHMNNPRVHRHLREGAQRVVGRRFLRKRHTNVKDGTECMGGGRGNP